jgi:predicted NBD/HSP70 family sugar kinase
MEHHVIGLDVGGTKIEAVLFDGKKVLKTVRIPSEANKAYPEAIAAIIKALTAVRTPRVKAVGLATPGYITGGRLYCAPNNLSLERQRLATDVQRLSGLPVVHENDANCFAYAEYALGAAKGKPQNVVGIIIGTGIGGGIVLDGKLYRGSIGAAGELGHMPYLGGDYEMYGSGPAMLEAYRVAGGSREDIGAGDILRYRLGQRGAEHQALKASQQQFYEATARLSASLINTLNPDVLVYGGGVSKSIDYRRLRKQTSLYALPEPLRACKQLRHKLSDSAGSMGAALLALQHLLATKR